MNIFDAVMIIEGDHEAASEAECLEAWQLLLDTGTIYSLQGSHQRMAQQLIDEGYLNPPERQPQ